MDPAIIKQLSETLKNPKTPTSMKHKHITPGKKTIRSDVNSATYYNQEELKHIRKRSSDTPDTPTGLRQEELKHICEARSDTPNTPAGSHQEELKRRSNTPDTPTGSRQEELKHIREARSDTLDTPAGSHQEELKARPDTPDTPAGSYQEELKHIREARSDTPDTPAGSHQEELKAKSDTPVDLHQEELKARSDTPDTPAGSHQEELKHIREARSDTPDTPAGSHPLITGTTTSHTAAHVSSSAPQTCIHPDETHINSTTEQHALLSPLHRKRGKVREQEERVNTMIKSTTHYADEYKIFRTQLQNLSSALQEKEMKHEVLRVQVLRHKKKIPEDEIDYQTESKKYQKQLHAQTERMEVLECERRAKSDEVDKLRVELKDRLRVIVEHEIDLETHNIHYTSHAEERQQLEEDALNEIFDENISEDEMEIIDALEQKYGCRTQQLISMLICDYADIEARYKRDQLANTKGMVQLQSQTQELKATVAVLEEQLKETESNYPFTPSSTFLVQRIHQLERENKILQESNQELKEKARQADESKEQVLQEKQQEIEILTLEKDSEAMLALAIQDRLDQENPHNSAESSAVHLKLTKRIQEQNKDVARLQNEVQGKNERIAALRSEAINHQIRSFPTYCEDTGSFSKTADDDRSGDTADNSDLGLSQDAQFQDMQHLVRKKEEELNAERKRFAAREVELMAMVRESHPEISSGVADLRFFL